MKITYDAEADAAYIQITKNIAPGDSKAQICVPMNANIAGEINLDFNEAGELLGIEVLCASEVLPEDALNDATEISNP